MNIYFPYADMNKSAEILDDKRLQKVRSDIMAVLNACTEPEPEDGREPAVIKMWRGNEIFLIKYGIAVCSEWMSRGNSDNILQKMMYLKRNYETDGKSSDPPEWFGNEEYHAAQRSQLVRNQPAYYREKFPDTPDDLPLIWPRTPPRVKATPEKKDREKKVTRAERLKHRAELAVQDARDAAIEAGLDPDTLEPLADVQVDDDLAAL